MEPLWKQIKTKYELGFPSHMTHLNNLQSIISAGGISSKNRLGQQTYTDISNQGVQGGRAAITVPCTGRPLHDYVPLYWVTKTPMSSAVREHNDHLIYLRFSSDILQAYPPCVISDGNARTGGTQFWVFTQLSDLDNLDAKGINSGKYADDEELKRRKQSEILILDFLPLTHLHHVICPSDMVKQQVEQMLGQAKIKASVWIGGSNHYYRQA